MPLGLVHTVERHLHLLQHIGLGNHDHHIRLGLLDLLQHEGSPNLRGLVRLAPISEEV